MKKALLASTALVGAALLAAPAQAGTVGSGDNLSLKLSGMYWFNAVAYDVDDSAGIGRGYRFDSTESEIHINASNTADNGMKYGVAIELNANAADSTAADESWAFIDSDSFGRVELGDQDDASIRMMVGGWNASKGLGFGSLGVMLAAYSQTGVGAERHLAQTDWQNAGGIGQLADSTKATYFTPRFNGFQLGASWTPDSGSNGFSRDLDNDGNEENVLSLGANYVGNFDSVKLIVSAVGMWGADETSTGAEESNDLAIWAIGTKVDFSGFTVGASFRDSGDSGRTATGGGDQQVWDVGVGYQNGPWGVSVAYLAGERDNGTGAAAGAQKTEVSRINLGAQYAVAPGWSLRADVDFTELTNGSGVAATDEDNRAFMITNMWSF